MTGAPLALIADALLLLISASILRAVRVNETPLAARRPFWPAMREGLNFVRSHRLLITMAACVGVWQLCNQAAMVVQILFATRDLGLNERAVGLSYVALGTGTVVASAIGYRVARRLGPGPTLVLGFAICGAGWLALAAAPINRLGVFLYALMLFAVRHGRGVHLHQLPFPAPIGDSGAHAGPHDDDHALADAAARGARRAARRVAGRAFGAARRAGIRRRHRAAC